MGAAVGWRLDGGLGADQRAGARPGCPPEPAGRDVLSGAGRSGAPAGRCRHRPGEGHDAHRLRVLLRVGRQGLPSTAKSPSTAGRIQAAKRMVVSFPFNATDRPTATRRGSTITRHRRCRDGCRTVEVQGASRAPKRPDGLFVAVEIDASPPSTDRPRHRCMARIPPAEHGPGIEQNLHQALRGQSPGGGLRPRHHEQAHTVGDAPAGEIARGAGDVLVHAGGAGADERGRCACRPPPTPARRSAPHPAGEICGSSAATSGSCLRLRRPHPGRTAPARRAAAPPPAWASTSPDGGKTRQAPSSVGALQAR